MREQSSRRIVHRFVTLIFRLAMFLSLAGILWFGSQVAEAVARQLSEKAHLDERRAFFVLTAQAMQSGFQAVTLETIEPSPTPTVTLSQPSEPAPTTTLPPPTETMPPSATLVLLSPTPSPSRTFLPTLSPTTAPSPTSTPVPAQPFQIFATNTPRFAVFATNTPEGTAANPAPEPTLTPTLSPAPSATVTPPPVITPTAQATRPLPTLFVPLNPEEGAASGGTLVPTAVSTVPRNYNLVNVILLGGDDSLTQDNFNRTDTMIIVSINRDTGSVAMLSLPRDLYVYLPIGYMQRLNTAYAIGEVNGWTGGGFGLLRQTILYNLGINVHYYARVDFDGFIEVVDSLGGIDVAVDCTYQDYPLIGAEVPEGAFEVGEDGLWTLPVGYYHMNGSQALWYARTRGNSDDFDRGRRQQQILRAVWRQVLATGRLNVGNLPQLWQQATSVVSTDLGFDDILSLLPLALNLDVSRIENFSLVRTYHTTPWQTPDGDFVQLPNYETIRPLLEDFYTPPTESQLVVTGATVAVRNGTANPNWDRVAAERLSWEGFQATWLGAADQDNYTQTIIIDRTGQTKASSLNALVRILNVRPENIRYEPDPNREADFEVILGAEYNSCPGGVVPVETDE